MLSSRLSDTAEQLALVETHTLPDSELTQQYVAVNETLARIQRARDDAQFALGNVLAEYIIRDIRSTRPDVETVLIEPPTTLPCSTHPGCVGHPAPHRIVAALDVDEFRVPDIDPLNPAHYRLERLSEFLDPVPFRFNLTTREWVITNG